MPRDPINGDGIASSLTSWFNDVFELITNFFTPEKTKVEKAPVDDKATTDVDGFAYEDEDSSSDDNAPHAKEPPPVVHEPNTPFEVDEVQNMVDTLKEFTSYFFDLEPHEYAFDQEEFVIGRNSDGDVDTVRVKVNREGFSSTTTNVSRETKDSLKSHHKGELRNLNVKASNFIKK